MQNWRMAIDQKMLDELVQIAEAARENAYAPYSGYSVGAAVLSADGSIIGGCNVENASFGLTICAERAALFSMVSRGLGPARGIAVVVSGDAASPCGACRQVMMELCEQDAPVVLATVGGLRRVTSLLELLPEPFTASSLSEVRKEG